MPLSGVSTHRAALFARTRASRWSIDAAAVLGVAAALILLRSLAYLLFEQFGFDSDQAINGLMAKHLSQGRAFPLFFYGQTYMLAVESWVAVPFFWIGGPTVGALRVSLLAWNIAFAALLIVGLHRDSYTGLARAGAPFQGGRVVHPERLDLHEPGSGHRDARLRWWMALVPALFFLIAPPSLAKQLFEAQGGDIEPFVYVAALWFLRRRPIWFGVVLAIGFRNREFTMYAVPVLLAIEIVTGELTRARVRDWLLSLAIFFAVWESISALMPYADLAGPGTRGQLIGGFSGSQVGNLVNRLNWRPGEMLERGARLVPELLAWYVGGAQVQTSFPIGDHRWLAWLAAVMIVAAAARLVWLTRPRGDAWRDPRAFLRALRAPLVLAPFAWYILGVGTVAVVTFMIAKPVLTGYSRYALLGVLIPIGLTAAILALEPDRVVRRAVTCVVVAWAAFAVAQNVRLLMSTVREPPPNPIRTLTDGLIARDVAAATAGYWEAYIATFFAQERVRVTSTDFVRIQEYQDFFADHIDQARALEHQPCPGGERLDRWYLCAPPR